MKAYTLEYVRNYFEEQNCKLLSTEYKNSKTVIDYICKCGQQSKTIFERFKSGARCRKCCGKEKLTYEYVRNYFKERNCELLETEYINARTRMKYKCSCKHISHITWNNFQKGKRCMECSGSKQLTFDYVQNQFLQKGCVLLENEYINSKTTMRYLCICNTEWKSTWDNFKQGSYRCKYCADENTAKNSFQYKDYVLPSQTVVRIQGYESFALDELLIVFNENDLVLTKRNMPVIMYHHKQNQHRYYPDIFIPKQNTFIEVKSEYTYQSNIVQNMIKALAVRKLGYDIEFWIYDRTHFQKTIV
jgi:hypothetical protein